MKNINKDLFFYMSQPVTESSTDPPAVRATGDIYPPTINYCPSVHGQSH